MLRVYPAFRSVAIPPPILPDPLRQQTPLLLSSRPFPAIIEPNTIAEYRGIGRTDILYRSVY